jgi:2-oxoglutarate dehydrogenase E1 component
MNQAQNNSEKKLSDTSLESKWETSYLSGGSMAYVDSLYEDYLANPSSVDAEWRTCFDNLPMTNNGQEVSHQAIVAYFSALAQKKRSGHSTSNVSDSAAQKNMLIQELTRAFRTYGHKEAKLDPLNLRKPIPSLMLQPESHGLDPKEASEVVQKFRQIYCNTLGAEYKYLPEPAMIEWIQERIESSDFQKEFSAEEQKALLKSLTAAEGLEKYLGSKYVGQKRFSLEGGDALLPMLQALVERAGEASVHEVIIGMAHRGRLNVLVNLLGKAPEDLFGEFEGKHAEGITGDVKYHAGYSSHVKTKNEHILHLAMGFNPSHLEIIGPVVEGSVRARQHRRKDKNREQVVPVLIHGDAAFAGQGVIMEMLNFSQTPGFSTGGTVRIVVNNQIGFTTSNPSDARSSHYCTDIAKMIECPVFHVNADDPEMAVRVIKLAFDFRMRFKRDVFVDLVCYRRHGHNEADEPAITQPLMYDIIRNKQTIRQMYADQLVKNNVMTTEEVDALTLAYRDMLDRKDSPVTLYKEPYEEKRSVSWKQYRDNSWETAADTTVTREELTELAKILFVPPQDFTLHPVIKKLFGDYEKMREGEVSINWGYAENLAYATMLREGYTIRFSGEDCERGTFSHRHAVLHDFKNGQLHTPLKSIGESPDSFTIINSLLSEEAVLGFEYGYSSTEPESLVIWEAQFGDFANGAQMVIDQFLSSGEQKWGQLSGLVMLLPHGQEGQGPEHSSARLERYLQLCAQENMQVCVPTTPAQIFHLLRRQMIRPFRKPLIVMTPKSLLRHKLAVSSLSELSSGQFEPILSEIDMIEPSAVSKVIICSGKVYYDLLQKRRDMERKDVAIIRIEQLYPFPETALAEALAAYPNAEKIVWCQEEPQNQGSWLTIKDALLEHMQHAQVLTYVGRPSMAAPAVGSAKVFMQQQDALVTEALA